MSGKKVSKQAYYVAGHNGMVGNAIVRNLQRWDEVCLGKSHKDLDLTNEQQVEEFFLKNHPENVIIAAAKVGGIKDNDAYPVDYLMTNLSIAYNIIKSSHRHNVKKLLFLGSSCIYPKLAPQPITESSLLTGPLEPTNQWYAMAKIAAIKMCQAYRKQFGCNYVSAMPCNLYGVGDTYDSNRSHVIPGLIIRLHEAKVNKSPFVECWGTGNALREFLYVDDLARAVALVMDVYNDGEPINIGSGQEIAIKDLVPLIAKTVGYEGEIRWNPKMPDGTPRKIMDNSKITKLGWVPMISLEEGLKLSYDDYLSKYGNK